jgi:hypothetical protein
MGWLDNINAKKKEQVPKMFEGKSEDDILKMLQESSADKEKIRGLEAKVTEQDSAVARINTEFESVKARLAEADARRQPPPKTDSEEPADFVTDPDKAFAQRIGPVATITLQTAATTARMLAQQQLGNVGNGIDGRLFAMWGAELDVEAKKYPLVHLGNPNAWLGMYFYLKGLHHDELNNAETRKKKYPFLEPSTSTSVQQTADDKKDKPATEQLTPQELHIAKMMKKTPEQYLEQKNKMQFVGA